MVPNNRVKSMFKNWKLKNRTFETALIGAFVLLFSSCGKVKNSSSGDFNLYGSGVSGSTAFLSARGVLANNCLGCHSEWSNYTEQDFVSTFRVVRSSPKDSPLYTSIRGNDAGVNGNMPQNRPDLSFEDLMKIKNWITSM